jgi:hypothetical protein
MKLVRADRLAHPCQPPALEAHQGSLHIYKAESTCDTPQRHRQRQQNSSNVWGSTNSISMAAISRGT